MTIDPCVAPAEWDRFVHGSQHSLVFHRRVWLSAFHAALGGELDLLGVRSDGELHAVMPVYFRRYGPFRVAGSPLVIEDNPYLGPAVPESELASVLTRVRDHLRTDISFMRTLTPYSVSADTRRQLEGAGFNVSMRKTHRLKLDRGEDAVWQEMEGRCRTAIRKAIKSGVEVRRVTGGMEHIRTYYALVEQVYGAQGKSPPNPIEFYTLIWETLPPEGLLSLVIASVNGTDIAGALLAHDDAMVYYLDGASDLGHRRLNASNLVLWTAIQWAITTGRRELDFVGSDQPRLAKFKASFGGELSEYTRAEWFRSGVVRLARDWYGRSGRQLLGRLRRGT